MDFHGKNIVAKSVKCLWKIPWNSMENSMEFNAIPWNSPWKIP
jgi:hypothetical protein